MCFIDNQTYLKIKGVTQIFDDFNDGFWETEYL